MSIKLNTIIGMPKPFSILKSYTLLGRQQIDQIVYYHYDHLTHDTIYSNFVVELILAQIYILSMAP